MLTQYKGSQIEYEIQFEGSPEDSFIASAYNINEDRELDDTEILEFEEAVRSEIDQEWYEHQVGRAEAYADSLEDR